MGRLPEASEMVFLSLFTRLQSSRFFLLRVPLHPDFNGHPIQIHLVPLSSSGICPGPQLVDEPDLVSSYDRLGC